MHVPAQFEKVFVTLNQLGFVTPLKQVPARTVPQIVIDSVAGFQTLHESAEVGPRRLQNKVPVICHQAK